MRHLKAGHKLGVTPDHRRAMLRSLTLALIEQEQIRTTPARAKALRGFADHVITLAKRGDLHGRRQIVQLLGSTETKVPGQNRVRLALERVYTVLAPRFKTRNGGYTQMFRLVERRPGDNAEQCIMRYLPDPQEGKKASKGAGDKAKAKKAPEAKAEKKAAKTAAAEDKATDKKAKKPAAEKTAKTPKDK